MKYLDYGNPSTDSRQQNSLAILSCGAIGFVAYALFVRKYTHFPVSEIWVGIEDLWIFPIIASSLYFMSRWPLLIYAFTIALTKNFIIFPYLHMRSSNFSRMPILDLLFLIPYYLILTAFISWISNVLFVLFLNRFSRSRYFAKIILVSICFVASVYPYVYKVVIEYNSKQSAIRAANGDWEIQKPKVYKVDTIESRIVGAFEFSSLYDHDTGFCLAHDRGGLYEKTYNDRIRQLLKEVGIPIWSIGTKFVDDADMIAMLSVASMHKVCVFPFLVSDGITVDTRNGEVIIRASRGGVLGQSEIGGAFVGRLAKYPGIIFVRCGNNWVAACTEDGWVLNYVHPR